METFTRILDAAKKLYDETGHLRTLTGLKIADRAQVDYGILMKILKQRYSERQKKLQKEYTMMIIRGSLLE